MPKLYHDNDADLLIRRLDSTLTPQWAVVTDPAALPVVPVHASLAGTAAWDAAEQAHVATIEGDAVTAHLPATDLVTLTPRYAVVVWSGSSVRKVLADIEVYRVRE